MNTCCQLSIVHCLRLLNAESKAVFEAREILFQLMRSELKMVMKSLDGKVMKHRIVAICRVRNSLIWPDKRLMQATSSTHYYEILAISFKIFKVMRMPGNKEFALLGL